MRVLIAATLVVSSFLVLLAEATKVPDSIYAIAVKDARGANFALEKYRNRVLIIANLASECGFTEAGYTRLNKLQEQYSNDGLQVLGFPCNQFGAQEPGSSSEVEIFAQRKGATWQVFEKIEVNGPNSHPLYRFLKGEGIDANGCVDDEAHCRGWAEEGECDANPDYMLKHCQLSCKVCEATYEFGGDVAWNFEYFIVDGNGKVVGRFRSREDITGPEARGIIESALQNAKSHTEL